MKTTIDIADPLLRQAKRLAHQRKTTLKAIIETALRDTLASEARVARSFKLHTPTFAGKGLQPGLSWDDWTRVRELAYEGRGG